MLCCVVLCRVSYGFGLLLFIACTDEIVGCGLAWMYDKDYRLTIDAISLIFAVEYFSRLTVLDL